ncbi:MAG: beta strand repeat-containing protein [Nitrospiria bacterium]
MTCSLSPASVTPVANGTALTTLTVGTTSTAPVGSYVITVTGTSGILSHTTTFTLTLNDYSLTVSPASATTVAGNSTTSTVTVTSLSGFNSSVALSCSISPVNATVSCNVAPASVTPIANGTATATLTTGTTNATPTGAYTVTVSGVSGTVTRTSNYILNVFDFSLSVSPVSSIQVVGGTANSTLTVTSFNGFNLNVSLTCGVTPSTPSITCNLAPASVTPVANGTATSSMSLATTSITPLGTYTATITGSAAGQNRTATYSLTVNDFSLSATPAAAVTSAGTSTATTLTVTSLNGFNSAVALTCSISPADPTVSCSYNFTSVTPAANGTATSTLTVSTAATTPLGTYTVTMTGISGGQTHTATYSLAVNNFSVAASPVSVTTSIGNSTTSTVTVTSLNGYNSSVSLTCGTNNGTVGCSLNPVSVTPAANGTASSLLTITTQSTTLPGTYLITITGAGGGISHQATVSLVIQDFSLALSPSSITTYAGNSTTSTVTVTSLNGYNSAVALSCSTNNVSIGCSLNPVSVTPAANGSATAVLSVTTLSTLPAGNYTVTVTGSSTGITHQVTFSLGIIDYSIGVSPSSSNVNVGFSTTSTVIVTSLNGFNASVGLTCGTSNGTIGCSLTPAIITPSANGSATSSLSITTNATTPAGNYSVTVTGLGAGITHQAVFNLLVSDYSIGISPAVATTSAGNTTITSVTVTSLFGFSAAVSLSCTTSNLNLGCSLSPASVTPAANGTASSALSITAASTTSAGNYSITVTGTSGGITHQAVEILTINDFSLSISPSSQIIGVGYSTTSTVNLTSLNGFNSPVTLVCSSPNATISCSTAPGLVTPVANGSVSSVLSVISSSTTTAGNYTMTVTATGGGITHQALFILGVIDYSLGLSSSTGSVAPGFSTTTTVIVTSLNGYSLTVGLNCTTSNAAVGCGVTPPTVTPVANGSATSILTVTTNASTPPANYVVTITGLGDGISHQTVYNLSVVDFAFSISPSSGTVTAGFTLTSTAVMTSLNGFNNPLTLTCSSPAPSLSCGLSPSPVSLPANGSSASTLTIITTTSTQLGTFTLTITATGGGITHQGTYSVTVLPPPPAVTTLAATGIGMNSATLNGTINPFGGIGTAWFEYGTSPSMGLSTPTASVPANNLNNPVSIALGGLLPNTIYYYRIDGQNSGGTSFGSQLTFTTLALPPVVVTGNPATNITQTSASLNGTANPNGVNGIAWFDYGLTTSYNLSSQTQAISGSVANSVVISIFGLSPNTTYHYRIGATNNGGTTFGTDSTFTTLPNPPSVTTLSPATNITQSSGTIGGVINPNGVVATGWFEWGQTASYGFSSPAQPFAALSTGVNYTYVITGLSAYTTYHYRADGNNAGGTSYGADAVFTTLPLPPAIVGTPLAQPVFQTTATLNGSVNPNVAPGQAFFNYGLTAAYGSATTTVPISGSAIMNVSVLVGNLTSLTTYHYQLVAYNAGGTVYGPDATFTTIPYPPLVITDGATNIGTNTAVLNGEVNPNGVATTAWFQWGTSTSYGFSNSSTPQVLSAVNSYIILSPVSIGSLAPNTTYYFRVVAQSSAGTTTGVPMSFTTLSGGVSPPGLSFSTDPGYNSVLGYTGANPYLFKVVYTSPNNLAPATIGLYLDGASTGLPMTLDSTAMGTVSSTTGGPVINSSNIADGIVGGAYNQNFSATGGALPYTWSVTGTLPAGLAINSATGQLSGTPGSNGTYPLTITVTDSTAGIHLTSSVNVNLIICSYTTGCQYRVTPPVLNAGVGFYYFAASDGLSTISLSSSGTLAGPTVPGTPSSTPVGNNVVVTPVPGYAINFATVNAPGSTTVSALASVPAIPSSYTLPLTNIYQTNISTTAGYNGNVTICINYSSAYFINQNAIVLLHYDAVQAKWINTTSYLDVVHNIVCGIVSSPSTFALVMTGSTAIGLSDFNTISGDGNVLIEWDTQTETNQLGFNVLRGLSIDGAFTKINGQMIPSRGNAIYGAHYQFMDYGVTNGETYYYELESIDTGNRTVVQFVSLATPQAPGSATETSGAGPNQSVATAPSVDQNSLASSGSKQAGSTLVPYMSFGNLPGNLGDNQENKKTEPLPLLPINVKILSDRIVLSWIPLDASDTYMIWRSEEKNGFYQMINDKLVVPEVLGNMDEKDYLIKVLYEDKKVESGKTYYYKVEQMVLGGTGQIVGWTSGQITESIEGKKSEEKPLEVKGLELLQPVIIDHQGRDK